MNYSNGCLLLFFSISLAVFFSNDPVPEALAHHWTHDCRLLEKNIDKGFCLLRKIDFSVVMLLKMSVQAEYEER
jgi:hypothetical protein